MKWLRKTLFILLFVIVLGVILLAIFISPVAKWAIEKYSVEYTGRQIKMDKLGINLFTGSIRSNGLKIYEAKSNKVFFECSELYANISVHKFLASEYELTEIKLTKPTLNIIEKGNRFNFSDLIDRFGKKSPAAPKKSKQIIWSIKNVDIDFATIVYTNTSPFNTIKIDRCNINIPGISWNNKVYSINTDFSFASGGDVKGKITFDKNSWVYDLLLNINRFDIKPFYTYLKDYMRVNSLDGLLSTNLKISGNMHNAADIATSGTLTGENFSIVDNTGDKLTAFDKIEIKVDSINTAKNIYRFASIDIIKPFIKLEMYKDGYNFNRLSTSPAYTTDTSTTTYANVFLMMADYIQNIVNNYVVSEYNADKFSIEDGQFEFIDYTLYEKFGYDMEAIHLYSDRLSSNNSKIYFDASATLNHSGQMKGTMDINPKDFKDFDIDCTVKNMIVSDFNPYSKYYVATPFLDGIADYTNKTTVIKRQLKSDNLLIVNKIIAGKKDKTNKPQYNMPIRLAVALLKDVHGNIKLDIPVAGSLDDPKFKWGKVVWHVLGNLLVKAATAPFRLLAGVFGGKEDDYKEVDFSYLQTSVTPDQQKQLDKLAKIAKEKPDVKLELIQVCNKEDEAEALAVYDAKKKYLGVTDSVTDDQLKQLSAISIDDSSFNKYVTNKIVTTTTFISTQEKCMLLIGKDNLAKSIDSIMQKRNMAITNYLLQQQVPTASIDIHNTDKPNDPNLGSFPKLIINVAAADDSDKK